MTGDADSSIIAACLVSSKTLLSAVTTNTSAVACKGAAASATAAEATVSAIMIILCGVGGRAAQGRGRGCRVALDFVGCIAAAKGQEAEQQGSTHGKNSGSAIQAPD